MKKIMVFAPVLLFSTIMNVSHANDFSYSYIEAGIDFYDSDIVESGLALNASLAIDDRAHFFLARDSVELEGYGMTFHQHAVGIGTHFSRSETTDLVFEGSLLYLSVSDVDLDLGEPGFNVRVKVREKINDRFEGNAGFNVSHFQGDDITAFTIDVGGRIHVNSNISAGVNYEVDEGSSVLTSSLRMSFL